MTPTSLPYRTPSLCDEAQQMQKKQDALHCTRDYNNNCWVHDSEKGAHGVVPHIVFLTGFLVKWTTYAPGPIPAPPPWTAQDRSYFSSVSCTCAWPYPFPQRVLLTQTSEKLGHIKRQSVNSPRMWGARDPPCNNPPRPLLWLGLACQNPPRPAPIPNSHPRKFNATQSCCNQQFKTEAPAPVQPDTAPASET